MSTTRPVKYAPIAAADVPATVRFDVPRRNQGQIVEIAYAAWPRTAGEAGHGDRYQRIVDGSLPTKDAGRVTYLRRAR